MEDFATTLSMFLDLMRTYDGRPTQFSVDFKREEIKIHEATSGFLKRLYGHAQQNCSFHEGTIEVQFFKR